MSTYYEKFNQDGFIVIKNFVNSKNFDSICASLTSEIETKCNKIDLSKVGGSIMGNLNVYPGKYSQVILEELKNHGLNNILQEIIKKNSNDFTIRVGGNLSLPNKHNQLFHTDGNFNQEMLMISVATCEINKENGIQYFWIGKQSYEPVWELQKKNT